MPLGRCDTGSPRCMRRAASVSALTGPAMPRETHNAASMATASSASAVSASCSTAADEIGP
jgi:hypothetical protein